MVKKYLGTKLKIFLAGFLLLASQMVHAEVGYNDSVECAALYTVVSVASESSGNKEDTAMADEVSNYFVQLAQASSGNGVDQIFNDVMARAEKMAIEVGDDIGRVGELLDRYGDRCINLIGS